MAQIGFDCPDDCLEEVVAALMAHYSIPPIGGQDDRITLNAWLAAGATRVTNERRVAVAVAAAKASVEPFSMS
jgi:hypothetical protein